MSADQHAKTIRDALFAAKDAWFSGRMSDDGRSMGDMSVVEFNNRVAPGHAALDELVSEIATLKQQAENVKWSRDLNAAEQSQWDAQYGEGAWQRALKRAYQDERDAAVARVRALTEALARWHRDCVTGGDCACPEIHMVNLCASCSADEALRSLAAECAVLARAAQPAATEPCSCRVLRSEVPGQGDMLLTGGCPVHSDGKPAGGEGQR